MLPDTGPESFGLMAEWFIGLMVQWLIGLMV